MEILTLQVLLLFRMLLPIIFDSFPKEQFFKRVPLIFNPNVV